MGLADVTIKHALKHLFFGGGGGWRIPCNTFWLRAPDCSASASSAAVMECHDLFRVVVVTSCVLFHLGERILKKTNFRISLRMKG